MLCGEMKEVFAEEESVQDHICITPLCLNGVSQLSDQVDKDVVSPK